MTYDLILGDVEQAGHCITEHITFDVNFGIEKMLKAYEESCNKLRLTFDIKDNWFKREGDYERVWCEYGENYISSKAAKILKDAGCFKGISYEEIYDGKCVIWEDEDRATLIMNFISLSMPKKFKYKINKKKKGTAINSLIDFGYGLYDF